MEWFGRLTIQLFNLSGAAFPNPMDFETLKRLQLSLVENLRECRDAQLELASFIENHIREAQAGIGVVTGKCMPSAVARSARAIIRSSPVSRISLTSRRAAQNKGKTARSAPIYGEMRHWLEHQKQQAPAGCPWVFFYRSQPVGAHLDGWREACDRAGVPNLLFHDLRRSAVSNMTRAGIPRPIAWPSRATRPRACTGVTTSRVRPISAVRASRWNGIY